MCRGTGMLSRSPVLVERLLLYRFLVRILFCLCLLSIEQTTSAKRLTFINLYRALQSGMQCHSTGCSAHSVPRDVKNRHRLGLLVPKVEIYIQYGIILDTERSFCLRWVPLIMLIIVFLSQSYHFSGTYSVVSDKAGLEFWKILKSKI